MFSVRNGKVYCAGSNGDYYSCKHLQDQMETYYRLKPILRAVCYCSLMNSVKSQGRESCLLTVWRPLGFGDFWKKKRLNARGFAREFLQSGMLYRPGKSLKRRGKSSGLH